MINQEKSWRRNWTVAFVSCVWSPGFIPTERESSGFRQTAESSALWPPPDPGHPSRLRPEVKGHQGRHRTPKLLLAFTRINAFLRLMDESLCFLGCDVRKHGPGWAPSSCSHAHLSAAANRSLPSPRSSCRPSAQVSQRTTLPMYRTMLFTAMHKTGCYIWIKMFPHDGEKQ